MTTGDGTTVAIAINKQTEAIREQTEVMKQMVQVLDRLQAVLTPTPVFTPNPGTYQWPGPQPPYPGPIYSAPLQNDAVVQ